MRNGMVLGMMLGLAGCGGGATTAARDTPRGWTAINACATLDKAVVAGIAKTPIARAELEDVAQGDRNSTRSSTCSVTFADGRLMTFVTRQFASETNTPPDLADTARELTGGGLFELVPGIGRLGLYNRAMNQLSVYAGPNRYFDVIFPPDLSGHKAGTRAAPPVKPADPVLKAEAIAIAHHLGA